MQGGYMEGCTPRPVLLLLILAHPGLSWPILAHPGSPGSPGFTLFLTLLAFPDGFTFLTFLAFIRVRRWEWGKAVPKSVVEHKDVS